MDPPVVAAVASSPDWTVIAGLAASTIAAIAAAAVSVITASRQAKTDLKVDTVSQKTAQIETSVNSEKTRLVGELAAAQEQVSNLKGQVDDHKRTAALLAQAAAIAVQTTAVPSAAIPATALSTKEQRILEAQAALLAAQNS